MGRSVTHNATLFARRRWGVAMALAVGAALLQSAPEFLDGEQLESIALRFSLWVVETPLQMVALSLAFEQCVRRRANAPSVMAASLLVATALGALAGVAFVFVFQELLGVELDEKGPLSLPLVAGFGAIAGVFKAGIWALAFVSPHLTERA